MGSVLIVMPKPEDAGRIAGMVQSSGIGFEAEICKNGAEALRVANERDFGVVISTKKLRDMSYSDLAEYLPVQFGLIILTSDATLETFSERIVKLLFPCKRMELLSTIEMMTSGFYRRKKKKNDLPREKSDEEMKIIAKAKQVLMDRNGMTEPEAFRYIQKNSMDAGRKSMETAEMILLMYGE